MLKIAKYMQNIHINARFLAIFRFLELFLESGLDPQAGSAVLMAY